MMDGIRFRRLLNKVSTHADASHIKTAKFMLGGTISRKQLEQCVDMKDIFERLMMKELIAPDNVGKLRQLLKDTFDNVEIMNMLEEYERSADCTPAVSRLPRAGTQETKSNDLVSRSQSSTEFRHTNPSSNKWSKSNASSRPSALVTGDESAVYRKLQPHFDYAAKHLGKEWKILARLMNLTEDDIRHVEEHCGGYDAQSQVVMKMWLTREENCSAREFRRLLRRIPRNDIADELHDIAAVKPPSSK